TRVRRWRRRRRPRDPCGRFRASDSEFLYDGLYGHDVPLESELRVREPGGDADELREVEDRQPELATGRRLELLLPRVQRQVAERAWRHHRVRAGLHRL